MWDGARRGRPRSRSRSSSRSWSREVSYTRGHRNKQPYPRSRSRSRSWSPAWREASENRLWQHDRFKEVEHDYDRGYAVREDRAKGPLHSSEQMWGWDPRAEEIRGLYGSQLDRDCGSGANVSSMEARLGMRGRAAAEHLDDVQCGPSRLETLRSRGMPQDSMVPAHGRPEGRGQRGGPCASSYGNEGYGTDGLQEPYRERDRSRGRSRSDMYKDRWELEPQEPRRDAHELYREPRMSSYRRGYYSSPRHRWRSPERPGNGHGRYSKGEDDDIGDDNDDNHNAADDDDYDRLPSSRRFGERDEYEKLYDRRDPRRGRRERPSATIYVKGIPVDKDEADVYKLFEGLPGCPKVESVRIMRDRVTGQSRGFAFVDFASVEDGRVTMEYVTRDGLQLDGQLLRFEYSSAPPSAAQPQSGSAHLDWVCNMCGAVNFARRLECYQCCAPRAGDAQRVSSEPDGPSCILKVSGLEPQVSEESLHYLFSVHVPVKEIRMVLDKFTSAPRGFAFVHFHSVADASRMLNMFQGHILEGQMTPLRVCFARDRLASARSAAASMAAAAVEAAQSMQQYSNWEPKEFQEDRVEVSKDQGKGDADKCSAQASATAGANQEAGQTGFVYDPSSGYYHNAATGYYYDANTGMYYDSGSKQWLMYDDKAGQYVACGGGGNEESVEGGSASVSTAAQNAVEAADAALGASKKKEAEDTVAKAAPKRRSGATIGAAAQLNPEGLLAASKASQEQKQVQEALPEFKRPPPVKREGPKPKPKPKTKVARRPGIGSVADALARMKDSIVKAPPSAASTLDDEAKDIAVLQGPGVSAENPSNASQQMQAPPVRGPQGPPGTKKIQGVIHGGKWGGGQRANK